MHRLREGGFGTLLKFDKRLSSGKVREWIGEHNSGRMLRLDRLGTEHSLVIACNVVAIDCSWWDLLGELCYGIFRPETRRQIGDHWHFFLFRIGRNGAREVDR